MLLLSIKNWYDVTDLYLKKQMGKTKENLFITHLRNF